MDYFNYKNGELFAEEVAVETLAAEFGTPLYVYSKSTFLDHLNKIKNAYNALDTTVCYSVKACGNINILKFMAQAGSGFDVVSGGELYRVLQAGGDAQRAVFAGVGKTDREIIEALRAGIGYFNVESEAELETLIELAKTEGRKAKAALRVNPDVDAQTHSFVTTGKKESKFGVDIDRAERVFARYTKNGAVKLCAIHIHLGSGGKTIEPYVEAVRKSLLLIDSLRKQGFEIEAINLGGGYGADYVSGYSPSAEEYASGIVPLLSGKSLKLIIEPGKSIAANAGILLCRVLYIKRGGEKKFVIVDAGMNDLIRPPLYDAFHFIWPAKVKPGLEPVSREEAITASGLETVDVVGPICERSDYFAQNRALPPVIRDELVAIFSAGAYGFSMASNYNARGRAAEVLVEQDRYRVIRRRETYETMVALERSG
ncbi:MAG: diaminopimelate decarboxylase [Deltaproteobacteria bacterium]|nr:diaminopimelate decarboxylase [Deltaproteobacteria bacterium]